MRSPRSRLARSRWVRAGAVAGAVALLAGCGSARPGVAAQVGDQTITIAQVDDASITFCEALAENNPGNVLTMGFARSLMLTGMVNRAIGDQIAAEYSVGPGAAFEQQIAAFEAQLASLPDDQREVVVDVQSAEFYRQSVTAQAATKLLEDEGVSTPSADQLNGRASLVDQQWTDNHTVVRDPRFSEVSFPAASEGSDTSNQVTITPGASIGFPVSRAAKDGQVTDSLQLTTIAQGLPASQRCGA